MAWSYDRLLQDDNPDRSSSRHSSPPNIWANCVMAIATESRRPVICTLKGTTGRVQRSYKGGLPLVFRMDV